MFGYRVRGIKEEDYRGGVYGKAGGPINEETHYVLGRFGVEPPFCRT